MYDDLSPRAQAYLEGLTRKEEFTCSKEELVEYFQRHHFPLYEPWIDFQMRFSGYQLKIPSISSDQKIDVPFEPQHRWSFLSWLYPPKQVKPDVSKKGSADWFDFEFVSKKDLKNDEALSGWKSSGVDWFFCGDGRAPYNYAINPKGEIAAYNPPGEYELSPISSSPVKFIEDFALRNELFFSTQSHLLYENPSYYWLGDPEGLTEILHNLGFSALEECSDPYTKWFMSDSLIICQGTWLDKKEFYVHLYGRTESLVRRFSATLKSKGLLKEGWPGLEELLPKS